MARQGKSPAFQFYPSDWLSDENTAAMTAAQEGYYIRAISHCWLEGSIPKDPIRLAAILGKGCLPDDARVVQGCFRECSENADRLVHNRLNVEREKQRSWALKSSKGGKKSAKSRASADRNGLRVVQPKGNSSSSSSSSSSNNNKEPEAPVSFPPDFDLEAQKAWSDWLDHKRTLGKPYKSKKSQQTKLNEWAGRGVDFAQAVYHSIGNNYQGIYLPTSNGGKQSRIEAEEARIEAMYQKALAEESAA